MSVEEVLTANHLLRLAVQLQHLIGGFTNLAGSGGGSPDKIVQFSETGSSLPKVTQLVFAVDVYAVSDPPSPPARSSMALITRFNGLVINMGRKMLPNADQQPNRQGGSLDDLIVVRRCVRVRACGRHLLHEVGEFVYHLAHCVEFGNAFIETHIDRGASSDTPAFTALAFDLLVVSDHLSNSAETPVPVLAPAPAGGPEELHSAFACLADVLVMHRCRLLILVQLVSTKIMLRSATSA